MHNLLVRTWLLAQKIKTIMGLPSSSKNKKNIPAQAEPPLQPHSLPLEVPPTTDEALELFLHALTTRTSPLPADVAKFRLNQKAWTQLLSLNSHAAALEEHLEEDESHLDEDQNYLEEDEDENHLEEDGTHLEEDENYLEEDEDEDENHLEEVDESYLEEDENHLKEDEHHLEEDETTPSEYELDLENYSGVYAISSLEEFQELKAFLVREARFRDQETVKEIMRPARVIAWRYHCLFYPERMGCGYLVWEGVKDDEGRACWVDFCDPEGVFGWKDEE